MLECWWHFRATNGNFDIKENENDAENNSHRDDDASDLERI